MVQQKHTEIGESNLSQLDRIILNIGCQSQQEVQENMHWLATLGYWRTSWECGNATIRPAYLSLERNHAAMGQCNCTNKIDYVNGYQYQEHMTRHTQGLWLQWYMAVVQRKTNNFQEVKSLIKLAITGLGGAVTHPFDVGMRTSVEIQLSEPM